MPLPGANLLKYFPSSPFPEKKIKPAVTSTITSADYKLSVPDTTTVVTPVATEVDAIPSFTPPLVSTSTPAVFTPVATVSTNSLPLTPTIEPSYTPPLVHLVDKVKVYPSIRELPFHWVL